MTRKSLISCDKVSFRFRREEHLKGRKEIREVFDRGEHYGCKGAKLFILKNDLPYNRICFTFSKVSIKSRGFWNAVARNRDKRLSREAYRSIKFRLCGGYDIILLVYPEPEKNAALDNRARQLESLFKKAGLLI